MGSDNLSRAAKLLREHGISAYELGEEIVVYEATTSYSSGDWVIVHSFLPTATKPEHIASSIAAWIAAHVGKPLGESNVS